MAQSALIAELKENITAYPDFPKPGVLFRDVFSVLSKPKLFGALIEYLQNHVKEKCIDAIVGLDARGFLFGSVLSLNLNIPFVPVRKAGKLPGDVCKIDYALEYGSSSFEIQKDSIKPGQKVVIIDDLLATGGTMAASIELLQKLNVEVTECITIIELLSLEGRKKLNVPFHSVVQF